MISYNSFNSPHIHKKMFDSSIPLKTSFRQSISFYQPPSSDSMSLPDDSAVSVPRVAV